MKISSSNNFPCLNLSSYLVFTSGRTGNELDSAFGKNSESITHNIGYTLAQYAKYKNPSINILISFPTLIFCDSLISVFETCLDEALSNSDINNLINSSTYASSLLSTYNGDV